MARVKVQNKMSTGNTLNGLTMPQVTPHGPSESPGETARRSSQMLLAESRAMLPFNVQKHIDHQTEVATSRERRLQAELSNTRKRDSNLSGPPGMDWE